MSSATVLKEKANISTSKHLILCILTGGFFSLMWLYRLLPEFNRITNSKISSDGILYFSAISAWFTWVFIPKSINFDNIIITLVLLLIALLISSIYFALITILVFQMRAALQEYAKKEFSIELKINPIYTFLFIFFHINYCINDLAKQVELKDLSEK
ncbi:hypothetical protein VQ643_07875 [Pseudomonas sp. F1_0610]|uniref:hypothetical protein n=1 Tax=Pseudomonas sp. F1_0610 TaxID=3114284 RepID=UPI0039C2A7B3